MKRALPLLILLAPPVQAATSCYDVPCTTTCSPAPAAISTLVPPSAFPAGANLPLAFVDTGDGRGRFLIATQEGAVLLWSREAPEPLPLFLDLRAESGGPVAYGGERGLLALAVDPNYTVNGRFYVFYTRNGTGLGDLVVARYERSAADPDVADPASATTIIVIGHPGTSHNGGQLAFGPDGFLYLSTGDGGGGCDDGQGAAGDGQRTDSLLGKILRLDVRGIDPAAGPPDCALPGEPANYTVPSDNPFAGAGPACGGVWALGLRNPFRFSFDRETGDLYTGDVGQAKWEEINLKAAATPAPVNFGWSCREGCETSANDESSCPVPGCPLDPGATCEFPRAAGHWDPILCHHNPDWHSVIAGYRYRGSFVPSLTGAYLYTDAQCGQIWKTTTLDPANPAAVAAECWASGFAGAYAFAEDHLGELYLVRGGAHQIECIHNGAGCEWAGEGIFADGFESGNTGRWSQ